ncbi:MAG: disulfide bond formation protein B [Planctomycetes bacterium]|nr:disulfide bond formation protein B [Planctomycetota bacterium]
MSNTTDPQPASARPTILLWLALGVSLVAVAGSLYLSLGMNLKACPLCFYQRTFAMSLVGVLGLGLCAGADKGLRPGMLGLLALPLATGGLGVAAFHVSLEVSGKLECPAGVLGLGTGPQQSLAVFALIFALVIGDVLRGAKTWALPALGLGGLFALASCISNPPMPEARPYDKPPDVCRPPYRSTT